MRRALALALLGLGLGGALAAQTVKAAVGGELTAPRYSTVLVPIAVDMAGSGGQKLGSYTARLTWDPARLNFYSVAAGNFPPPQVNTDSLGYGVLKFTSISPVGVGGLATVAQLLYSVGDTVGTPLTLSFSEMSAAGTFANLLPQLTVTSAMFCPSRGLWGDIDRDGASNSRDALLVLSKVVGLPVDTVIDTVSTQPLVVDTLLFDSGLGDVNADANVTSVDALIILSTAVGIPIPGQRVMILAPGGCGTGSPKTLAVFPGTAQLGIDQAYQLLAQGRDSAGRVVTLSNATWRSSNLNVAGVDADGTVHGRAPGTTTITAAVGPGVTATATVTVAPRTKWYVDVSVTGAPVQFGTAAFPFDHPLRAFSAVHEGDTIAVAPGTYDFVDYGILNVGVVIQGGTPNDTNTRPLFRDAQAGYHTALQLSGGLRTVVHNVAFRNFNYAVDLDGVRSFALEDSKVEVTSGNYGTGIYTCANSIDSVRVDRSVLLGDSTGDALTNDYCVPRTPLLTVRDSRISGWSDGINWPDVDSLVVLRSDISANQGNGISVSQEYNVTPSVYVAHSRLARNGSAAISGYPMRRLVLDSTAIQATAQHNVIEAQGGCGECGDPPVQVALHGDTITMAAIASNYSWMRATAADTFSMDGTVVRFPADTFTYVYSDIEANVSRVTRSQFLNLGGGQAVRFSSLRLFADSITMTGCAVATCDQAYGFYPNNSEGGPQLQALTLTRSHFTQVGTPLYGSVNGTATISGNVIDSASSAIQVYADSVTVTDNVLTRISAQGFQLQSYAGTGLQALVARDSVTCTGATARGIDITRFPFVIEDNYTSVCYLGIYEQQALPGSVVRRNTVRGAVDGITVNQLDTVTVRVDSNGVSGASDAAVARVQGGRVSMTHNNISGNYYGVFFGTPYYGGGFHDLHDNSFTGNTQYAVYSLDDSVNAQANWWGDAAGPSSGLADSAFGRVDTTAFLTSAPLGLPGLAPRFLATAAPIRPAMRPAAPTASAPRSVPVPVSAARVALPRQHRAFVIGPRMPAATIARVQEQIRRRAEHEAREAASGSTRP